MYQREPGVLTTAVGYTAGKTLNPTYKEVCSGKTYHAEAVQLTYDPAVCRILLVTRGFLNLR